MTDAEDIAALLEPIPGAQPGGRDLRYEGDYDRIAEARREDNVRQQFGETAYEVKHADWTLIEQLCRDALTAKTKDLRIACSLAEAWVVRRGFAGVAPALALIEALCRDWWGRLQPYLGSDADADISAIDSLNHRLAIALRQVPVVLPATLPGEHYTWSDYLNAQQLERVRQQDAKAAQRSEQGGAVTLAMFESYRDRSATDMFAATAHDLAAALAAYATLDATLDACCGKDAPSLGRSRDVAREIADFAQGELAARRAKAAVMVPPVIDQPTAVLHPVLPVPAAPQAPMSREAAYRQLELIAAQLHLIEPHSPVPYVLDRLAAWGDLPLPQLEADLRAAGSSIAVLLDALGLHPEE